MRGFLAALALAGLAGGCATAPPVAAPITAPAPLSGRLALSVAATPDSAARSATLAFEWTGDAQRGSLQLSTPLGNQVAQARWEPGRAELRTAEGLRSFEALDPLAEAALGEPLPLQALADWLRGRASPAAPVELLEPLEAATAGSGRARWFRQAGWSVDLRAFGEGRIDVRREAPAPSVRLRIVLDVPAP